MNESVQTRGATEARRRSQGPFSSLLVAADLTSLSDRVLRRAAQLPLADGAQLTLLHVVPDSLGGRERRDAERDAKKQLAEETRILASSLSKTVKLKPVVATGVPVTQIAEHAASTNAELIVMGRGSGRPGRDSFLGSTAERVLRGCQVPVLVVRIPARAPYARPVLALDLDQAAQEVLRSTFRVVPEPRPRIRVVHAVDLPYRGLVYPSLSKAEVEDRCDELEEQARQRITMLLAEFSTGAGASAGRAPLWKAHVRCGSPRLVIKDAVRHADADLLALGTHGYTSFTYLLLGTVAGDVLRDVPCDVLVVPPRSRRG